MYNVVLLSPELLCVEHLKLTILQLHGLFYTIIHTWVSRGKKVPVADHQYFENGNMQQCGTFRHNKYNFYLVVCEVSMP